MKHSKGLWNVVGFAAMGMSVGCANIRNTDTARTGTEQLLISNAVDQALAKIDFRPLGGHKVFLDDKYLESVDKNYVIGSVRHRLLKAGAELAEKPDQADLVLELRSGAVGTDDHDLFVGIPAMNMGPLISTPELTFFKRVTQIGTAKIGLVAYDAKTRHVLGEGAVTRSQARDHNWFALGMGPYNSGNVKQEVDYANYAVNDFPLEMSGNHWATANNSPIQQTVFAVPGTEPAKLPRAESLAEEAPKEQPAPTVRHASKSSSQ